MKKILKWVGLGVLVLGALWAATFFIGTNSKGTRNMTPITLLFLA